MSNKPEIEGLKESAESAKVKMAEVTPTVKIPEELLTPAAQANVNALVTESIKGIFAQLGPPLASMALTPEKMAEAEKLRRAPDPAVIAREIRERKIFAEDLRLAEEAKAATQRSCGHKYLTGQTCINLVRNYPDRQVRGICVLCSAFITPREWRIGAPDTDNPRGKAYIAEAHPQYKLVLEALQAKG